MRERPKLNFSYSFVLFLPMQNINIKQTTYKVYERHINCMKNWQCIKRKWELAGTKWKKYETSMKIYSSYSSDLMSGYDLNAWGEFWYSLIQTKYKKCPADIIDFCNSTKINFGKKYLSKNFRGKKIRQKIVKTNSWKINLGKKNLKQILGKWF